MTPEQKAQLQALLGNANRTTEEQAQLDSLQKLAAEEVGGTTFGNTGYTEQFLNTAFNQYTTYAPLTADFMRNQPTVMVSPTASVDYYILSDLTDAAVDPGDYPEGIGTKTLKVSIGFGKLWKKDELLKEDLIARLNQTSQLGMTFIEDNSPANPITIAKKKVLSEIVRNFENKAWNGVANAKGIGIVGMKTQHTKLNTTGTTNAGADNTVVIDQTGAYNTDGRFSKVNWTNDAAGQNAWATDVYNYINTLVKLYGANHFTLYVPIGAGPIVRNVLANYEKVSLILQQLLVNANGATEAGTKVGIFNDSEGRSYVNQFLDVKEIGGMAAGESYLYPDTVDGEWMYRYMEYGLANKPASGIRTYVGGLTSEMTDITGLNPDEVIQMYLGNESRAETLQLSMQWTGQIFALAVGMARLYSRVTFIPAPSTLDLASKITGTVNLSA